MSDERLILKHNPPHHRQRFYVLVGAGLLLVLGVWGLQIKMTFARYAADRGAQAEFAQVTERVNAATTIDPEVQDDGVAAMEALVKDMLAKQQAKDQVLDQVTETMKAEITADTQTETPAATN
ncbi:MAG: hypothetical protein QG626_54 [Patescibacteria group bacterium]|jgi:uncharacterized protein YhaN|nr:hypothetical protein [Patescibacteria group bacterium]